jgi:hypothetical protein
MKRIAFLSILFAALIELAIERAKVDLWIVAVVAVVILLWNVAARALRSHVDSQKARPPCVRFQGYSLQFDQRS